jgi:tartrate dehydrogenase/decarboxylase/D-malate dehydrogenase
MILSGAMMLDHIGELAAATNVRRAVHAVLTAGEVLTPDLGGTSSTGQMAVAIAAAVRG